MNTIKLKDSTTLSDWRFRCVFEFHCWSVNTLPNTYTLCPTHELHLLTASRRLREYYSFFWCFLLYQNTKFERKISDGTKHWGWYGDMDTTLLSYSHRHAIDWAQAMCSAHVYTVMSHQKWACALSLQKAFDGDGVKAVLLPGQSETYFLF